MATGSTHNNSMQRRRFAPPLHAERWGAELTKTEAELDVRKRSWEADAERTPSGEQTGLMRRIQDHEGGYPSVVPADRTRPGRFSGGAIGRTSGAGACNSSRRGHLRQVLTSLLALAALLPSCRTASNRHDLEGKVQLTRLTSDLSQLKGWFARSSRRPRAVVLLSPT